MIGFLSAFFTGVFACRWMVALVKKSKLKYFSFYCIMWVDLPSYIVYNMNLSLESITEGQLLLVDKPREWTSFQAVNKLRWAFKKNTS